MVDPLPEGATAKLSSYWVFQEAVAVLGEFMVMPLDIESEPDASPVQPAKVYCVPALPGTVVGDMIAWAELPLLYHPEPAAFPCPPSLTAK